MIKKKTHKGLAKRVKKTGTGKLKRGSAFRSHLATHKSQKQKRQLRKGGMVAAGDMKRIKSLI